MHASTTWIQLHTHTHTHAHSILSAVVCVLLCVSSTRYSPARRERNPLYPLGNTSATSTQERAEGMAWGSYKASQKNLPSPPKAPSPRDIKGLISVMEGAFLLRTTIVIQVDPARGTCSCKRTLTQNLPPNAAVWLVGIAPLAFCCFTSGVWGEAQFMLCFHSNTN